MERTQDELIAGIVGLFRDDSNPDTRAMYSTAYHAGLGRFGSIIKYDMDTDEYLCDFGCRYAWTPANELTRFCF